MTVDQISSVLIIIIGAFFFIYLMNARIMQLKYELDDLKNRVTIE